MQKPVNVLNVSVLKTVNEYDLETGCVGDIMQGYSLFSKQVIISDLNPETIKEQVQKILEKNYIDFQAVQKGNIFEDSRLTFQTFEDSEGNTTDKATEYHVDNDLYIEANNGNITMEELKQIFPKISVY